MKILPPGTYISDTPASSPLLTLLIALSLFLGLITVSGLGIPHIPHLKILFPGLHVSSFFMTSDCTPSVCLPSVCSSLGLPQLVPWISP